MNQTNASNYQPSPIPSDAKPVFEYVLDDIRERAEFGKGKYGTYLQPNNGRDALWDLQQELYDAVIYLRQKIIEIDMSNNTTPMFAISISADKLMLIISILNEMNNPILVEFSDDKCKMAIDAISILQFKANSILSIFSDIGITYEGLNNEPK